MTDERHSLPSGAPNRRVLQRRRLLLRAALPAAAVIGFPALMLAEATREPWLVVAMLPSGLLLIYRGRWAMFDADSLAFLQSVERTSFLGRLGFRFESRYLGFISMVVGLGWAVGGTLPFFLA